MRYYHIFSVHDTAHACYLQKSFIFDNKIEITSFMHFKFMYKHIVVKTHYISWVSVITQFSNSKSGFQLHSRSLAIVIVPFDRPYTISFYSSTVTMSQAPFPR